MNRRLKKRVAAIVPVHLYGQTADMDAIMEIAARHNVAVFEDACQAHGADYFSAKENRWRRAGSIGVAAAFSFYPGKNLGACGEAGAVTTNDGDLAQKIKVLRDHGQARKYYHDVEGYNGRLDAVQAGILHIKLKHLDRWNALRRECAARYLELLGSCGDVVKLPFEPDWAKAVYHLFVVAVDRRDELQKHLTEAKIGTGIHYPVPLHLQKAYRHLGYREGDFPVAEESARRILSLPMYPQLRESNQVEVAGQMKQFLAESTRTLTAAAVGSGR